MADNKQFIKVRPIGTRRTPFQDLYHLVLVRPWWQFVLMAATAFVAMNALFGLLYWVSPGAISGMTSGSFEECFFFSVQTLGTIGYGGMAPATRYGHILVTVEAFIGLLCVALLTGVTFSKFARPTARVRFSEKVAAPMRNGSRSLMFRMANERHNLIVEAQLRVFALMQITTPEGEVMRAPIDLKLVRSSTPMFALTWTALHVIDENSPFHGEGALARLKSQGVDIFLALTGLDETFAQTVHARHRYTIDDIAWNHRHADVMAVAPDGTRTINFHKFDDVELVPVPEQMSSKVS
jgi:inward rectifier potassium channel